MSKKISSNMADGLEMLLMQHLQQAIPEATQEELAELLQLKLDRTEDDHKPTIYGTASGQLQAITGTGSGSAQSDSTIAYPPKNLTQPFLNHVRPTQAKHKEEEGVPAWVVSTKPFKGEIDSQGMTAIRAPKPLMPWQTLWPVIHLLFQDQKKTKRLNIRTIVDKKIKQQSLRSIPWQYKPCWPNELVLVIDYSDHLTPFFKDFYAVSQHLQCWFGERLRLIVCLDAVFQSYEYQGKAYDVFPYEQNNAQILYIGDLGFLHKEPVASAQWFFVGQALARRSARIETLLVAHPSDWERDLQSYFQLHYWDGQRLVTPTQSHMPHRKRGEASQEEIERLLCYLSWAIELSPSLIRAVRLSLGLAVSVESLVIQHPALQGKVLFQWRCTERRNAYRRQFKQQGYDIQQMWQMIAPFEKDLEIELQVEQRQQIGRGLTQAQATFIDKLIVSEKSGTLNDVQSELLFDWIERMAKRAGDEAWLPETKNLYALYWNKKKKQSIVPEGIDPSQLPRWLIENTPNRLVIVSEKRSQFCVTDALAHQSAGVEIARFELTDQSSVTIQGKDKTHKQPLTIDSRIDLFPDTQSVTVKTLNQTLILEAMPCPKWASAIGRDRYGLFVEVIVKEISFVMRWMPPGQFLMGSPEDEFDRYDREGPRQPIVFTQGFWLAETTCTQELWQAVMGENPSQFQDNLQNPVEQVSWNDVKGFVQKINHHSVGLNCRLPSEAEWEYACRAGTITPFWFGNELTTDKANYDGNHPYHQGKKGEYKEKTMPVKSFQPNPWGLYQMHGNVWEWCEDVWHDNHQGADTQGRPRLGNESQNHVCRGGSWIDDGRDLRAACRSIAWNFGLDRSGFRLARGPESSSQQEEASAALSKRTRDE